MAIAIAREGGIGVIHKNMSIEEQAREVAIVKRAENGMIYDPVTIARGSSVRAALNLMHEFHIGGIPVVDEENHLCGYRYEPRPAFRARHEQENRRRDDKRKPRYHHAEDEPRRRGADTAGKQN